MSTNPSSHTTGSPDARVERVSSSEDAGPSSNTTSSSNAPAEATSSSQHPNPPSSIVHFSAEIIAFALDKPQIKLKPTYGDSTMLISGDSCSNYSAIFNEASRIGIGGQIRLSFDTAPETFGRLDVVLRGSQAFEEDEEAPSRSRVERQTARADGRGEEGLRRVTVINGEAEAERPLKGSRRGRNDGETRGGG